MTAPRSLYGELAGNEKCSSCFWMLFPRVPWLFFSFRQFCFRVSSVKIRIGIPALVNKEVYKNELIESFKILHSRYEFIMLHVEARRNRLTHYLSNLNLSMDSRMVVVYSTGPEQFEGLYVSTMSLMHSATSSCLMSLSINVFVGVKHYNHLKKILPPQILHNAKYAHDFFISQLISCMGDVNTPMALK